MSDSTSRQAASSDKGCSATAAGSPEDLAGSGPPAEKTAEAAASTVGGSGSGHQADGLGRQSAVQRVDRPHEAAWQSPPPLREPLRAAETPPAGNWLRWHAEDLIEQLQRWAEDLEARQAQINAISAAQDQRERQLRVRQSDVAAEVAEQQRAIERLIHQRFDRPEH